MATGAAAFPQSLRLTNSHLNPVSRTNPAAPPSPPPRESSAAATSTSPRARSHSASANRPAPPPQLHPFDSFARAQPPLQRVRRGCVAERFRYSVRMPHDAMAARASMGLESTASDESPAVTAQQQHSKVL